jgi:hypothetical protein
MRLDIVRTALVGLALVTAGCATTRLVGQRPPMGAMEAGPLRVVVLEPLSERLAATPPSSGGPLLFSGTATLRRLSQRVLEVVRGLRPTWQVVTPAEASTDVSRPAVVVRTLITGSGLVASDRAPKTAAFAFGLVVLPLLILSALPVEETQRVVGAVQTVTVDPKLLAQRLTRAPLGALDGLNLTGLSLARRAFALDVEYDEGLFADEGPRAEVLREGLVEMLAFAIVAFIEEDTP